jgi:hypothetical protein
MAVTTGGARNAILPSQSTPVGYRLVGGTSRDPRRNILPWITDG